MTNINNLQHNDMNNVFDIMSGMDDGSQHYLIFELNHEHYAIEILRVQKIKGWERVTPIPNTPRHLRGVMNLRGDIVPVVDLRLLFGMPFQAYNHTTVIVVLNVQQSGHQRTVGIVVDAVSDAHNIHPDEIKPASDFGASVSTATIQGVTTVAQQMMVVLDVDNLLTSECIG